MNNFGGALHGYKYYFVGTYRPRLSDKATQENRPFVLLLDINALKISSKTRFYLIFFIFVLQSPFYRTLAVLKLRHKRGREF